MEGDETRQANQRTTEENTGTGSQFTTGEHTIEQDRQTVNVEVFQHRASQHVPSAAPLTKVTLHVVETTASVPAVDKGAFVVGPTVVKEGVFVVGPADGAEMEFKTETEDPPEPMSEGDSDRTDESDYQFPQPFTLPKAECPDADQIEEVSDDESNGSQIRDEGSLEAGKANEQPNKLQTGKTWKRQYSEQELLDRRHLRSLEKLKVLDRKLKEMEMSEAFRKARKNPNLEENVTKRAFMNYFKGLSPDFQKLTDQRKVTYLATFGQCVCEQIEQERSEND